MKEKDKKEDNANKDDNPPPTMMRLTEPPLVLTINQKKEKDSGKDKDI